jgi:hypothetical protein
MPISTEFEFEFGGQGGRWDWDEILFSCRSLIPHLISYTWIWNG